MADVVVTLPDNVRKGDEAGSFVSRTGICRTSSASTT